MEKSSAITLSEAQILLYKEGMLPAGVVRNYGISSLAELTKVIEAGEYTMKNRPTEKEVEPT